MSIAAPTRTNGKLTEFFPLQKEELLSLYQMGLIKSAAYTYFALKLENPFCDRPIEIIIKEFAFRWGIPEKSVYRAIAKLKELEIININAGKLVVAWVISEPPEPPEPQFNTNELDNLETETKFSEVRDDSQKCEPILRSENQFSEVRTNSQSWENRSPKEPPDKDPESPQTLQTYSDFIRSLSEGERELFLKFTKDKTSNLERQINDLEAWLASENKAKQNRWEIYYELFREDQIKEESRNNKGFGVMDDQKLAAIARFKAERNRNRVDLKDNTRENSENNHRNRKNE